MDKVSEVLGAGLVLGVSGMLMETNGLVVSGTESNVGLVAVKGRAVAYCVPSSPNINNAASCTPPPSNAGSISVTTEYVTQSPLPTYGLLKLTPIHAPRA